MNFRFHRNNCFKGRNSQLEAGSRERFDEELHSFVERKFVVKRPHVILVEKGRLLLVGHHKGFTTSSPADPPGNRAALAARAARGTGAVCRCSWLGSSTYNGTGTALTAPGRSRPGPTGKETRAAGGRSASTWVAPATGHLPGCAARAGPRTKGGSGRPPPPPLTSARPLPGPRRSPGAAGRGPLPAHLPEAAAGPSEGWRPGPSPPALLARRLRAERRRHGPAAAEGWQPAASSPPPQHRPPAARQPPRRLGAAFMTSPGQLPANEEAARRRLAQSAPSGGGAPGAAGEGGAESVRGACCGR